ncbi:DUF4065 domain-containing protein [Epibacterium sp. DP7N7-1]|nr:DUF4065 domain-containing protein [Epibacterium sp. DP7N7-1]
MTVSVLSAARHMAERSGWSLTNLQLQKLIYLAHMFYMGRNEGEPLVHGTFEAWDYGPVHPQLYARARIYGSSPVQNIFAGVTDISNTPEGAILNEAYDALGDTQPGQLVNITHTSGGAWDNVYIPGARHISIPNAEILREYNEKGYDDVE